jgi:phosphoribosylaminoimidazole-succinocarboxamide synthase
VALLETALTGWPRRQGKVRDVYDLGDRLLMVATDRISAFDWVLPNGIPDKGRVLTGISTFWFRRLGVPNHLISAEIDDAGLDLPGDIRESLSGRTMLVRKARVVPFECVVRGYLSGSAWREYCQSRTVCGEPLPEGLVESAKIPTMFTPATKAESGHDENISFDEMRRALGDEVALKLKTRSCQIYAQACSTAKGRDLILADTKFEWGFDEQTGELLLVDEVLTPDSSRYWSQAHYLPGGPQPSFDKQFVRDWLDASGWDKASPPPELPPGIVAKTREKYVRAYEILTGNPFPWT